MFGHIPATMHNNLDTLSTPEVVKIWCAEYARTTACRATVVKTEGDWIFIQTPSHEGQPWQRCHFIRAIQTLQSRPDSGASIFCFHEFKAAAARADARKVELKQHRVVAA